MVSKEDILESLKTPLRKILLYAESSLPPGQFKAYRKLVLDAYGKNGYGKELDKLFNQKNNNF